MYGKFYIPIYLYNWPDQCLKKFLRTDRPTKLQTDKPTYRSTFSELKKVLLSTIGILCWYFSLVSMDLSHANKFPKSIHIQPWIFGLTQYSDMVQKLNHIVYLFSNHILYIIIIADVICTGIYLTLKGTNFPYLLSKPGRQEIFSG